MDIRREEYTKALDRLLWASDVPQPGPGNEYYVVRGKEGRMLAAGVCWKSRMHPRRNRFFVSVEELYRGRGYGTAIFRQMQADHPGAKWQGSADLDNEEAEWWLRGLGFVFSHRCYWLDAMIPDLLDGKRYALPVRALESLTEVQRKKLLAMAWTDYSEKYERVDPLAGEISGEEFVRSVLGSLHEQASCCLMDGEKIGAYVLFGAGADDWTISVKCAGHRLSDREMYRRFLIESVNRAFEQAGGLLMEADSFDEDAIEMMRLFGELPEDSYDTYVLE